MEVRSIVQEVIGLVYEWVDEEDDDNEKCENSSKTDTEECNLNDNSKSSTSTGIDNKATSDECDNSSKLNPQLEHISADVDNPPANDEVDNNLSSTPNNYQENCISKTLPKQEVLNGAIEPESSISDIDEDYIKAINLTKRRLHLMESLGFKVITRIDVCSNIIEYANEIGDVETARTYLQKCCTLAKMLYGPCSNELMKWSDELLKLNKTCVQS